MSDRKEYIDRGALIDKLDRRVNQLRKKHGSFDPYTDGFDEAVDIVSDAPAADVAEVVRCENCTFSTSLPLSDVVYGDYVLCCGGEKVPKNGFCNYGVRKDSADDE